MNSPFIFYKNTLTGLVNIPIFTNASQDTVCMDAFGKNLYKTTITFPFDVVAQP